MRTPNGLRSGNGYDNWTAIQSCLNQGYGRVFLPVGSWGLSRGLVVPKGVVLDGDSGAATLMPLSTYNPATPLVRLGDPVANTVAPEARIQNIGLEGAGLVQTAVYSNQIQELGGAVGCSFNGFTTEAIHFDGPNSPIPGCENFIIRDNNIQMQAGAMNPNGIHLHDIHSKFVVDNNTIVTDDAVTSTGYAIYCFNGWGSITNIHAERFKRAIFLDGASAHQLEQIEGHASVEAVVEIAAAGTNKITMNKIIKNGSQYSLFDSRGSWGGADYDLVFAGQRNADGSYGLWK